MNSDTVLIFQDGIYYFYITPAQRAGTVFLTIRNAYNKEIYRGMYLKDFGNNPIIKVRKGKSGTYTYYKVTFRCENVVFELIFLSNGVIKEVYRDLKYADYNTTRLVISTVKGGIKVVRKPKL